MNKLDKCLHPELAKRESGRLREKLQKERFDCHP